ncbi:hypothetical protein DFQ27_005184 [Actinomortierella ambigua]|uniref:Uncharacterized protein n=1 Tax=Actinomortierella ambigua TaxID=1343610 RepID=A0A9P6U285_9FUNG|nr:hypothetical protein DFQ27_005184 [Actinomortierella ambigua]
MDALRRSAAAAASTIRVGIGALPKSTAVTKTTSLYAFRPGQADPLVHASRAPRETISGLWFCLNMVFFATPGLVFAKKLCDGQTPEDMVSLARQHMDTLSGKF